MTTRRRGILLALACAAFGFGNGWFYGCSYGAEKVASGEWVPMTRTLPDGRVLHGFGTRREP